MTNSSDVLTTQQAARILGLSTTSVQKMVISGELEAWVTPGGHRRIFRSAIDKLVQSRGTAAPSESGARPMRFKSLTFRHCWPAVVMKWP